MIPRLTQNRYPLVLTGLCVALIFLFLGERDLWDIDEGMHAAIAQNMVSSGDWVTPRFNGEPFYDKPVLFNWLNSVAFVIFGNTEFAARLPAALCGLGTVLLAFSLGRKLYDPVTGFLGGVVLLTSLGFIALTKVVQYDIPFTFFTTLALYFFTSAVLDEPRRKWSFQAFYAAAALAVLVKGPLGVVIPGLVIGAWLIVTRRFSLLREMQIPLGLLIFLVIVTPWFVLMEKANPGYLDYFVVRQHFGNFLGGEGAMQPRHPEAFWYYVPLLLVTFMPWSLLLPQAAVRVFRQDRGTDSGMPHFLTIWVAVLFVFFSAATSKLATYLLPLFPAAALIVARYFALFTNSPTARGRLGLLAVTGGAFAILASLATYAIVEDPWTYWKHRSGIEWLHFEIFTVVFAGLFGVAAIFTWRRRHVTTTATLSLIAPFVLFFVLFVLTPEADKWRGAKDIGLELDAVLPAGDRFVFHGQTLDSAMFYADREGIYLRTKEELNDYLDSEDRVFAIVRTRARTAEDSFTGDYHVVKIIGNKAIVSNRPGPLP